MLALDALAPVAARRHRMTVEVPDSTELAVQPVASLVENAMIRRVVILDPGENLVGRKLAVVDRDTRLRVAPDETDAGDLARHQPGRQRLRQEAGIEIVGGA